MNAIAVVSYKLTAIHVLGLAGLGIVIGEGILRAVPVLARLSVPRAIVGGLVLAVLVLAARDRVVNLEFDTTLRDVLMIAFFTTIGLGASLRLLRSGGTGVVIFLGASVLGLVAQMALGAAAASGLGESPLVGLIPGAISLTGGPATALAFGPVLEKAGVPGASAVGVAAAVFGIVVSGMLGGYVGSFLIRRDKLVSTEASIQASTQTSVAELIEVDAGAGERHGSVLGHVVMMGIMMALGAAVSDLLGRWMTLPAQIGAMLVAAIVRNFDDKYQFAGLDQSKTQTIGDVALELFIVMALLTLKLWQLVDLAGPVLLILAGQVVLTVGLAWTCVYWLMGRSYTAAVMAGGYTGFMLGTTANAMASMNAIVKKSGPAPQAFFAVGIVGAFLIDFVNSVLLTAAIRLLG
jgi:glutamate:Na+ symporter, ESS family